MKWKVTPGGTVVRVPDIYVGPETYDTYEEAVGVARKKVEARIEHDQETLKRLEKGEAT